MNRYLLQADLEEKMQLSTRMLQYLIQYQMKKQQIQYCSPFLLETLHEQEMFSLYQTCLDQLNDAEIVYCRERKQAFAAIRAQQQRENEAKEKNSGILPIFLTSLFGSKKEQEKVKEKQKLRTIFDYSLKSISYVEGQRQFFQKNQSIKEKEKDKDKEQQKIQQGKNQEPQESQIQPSEDQKQSDKEFNQIDQILKQEVLKQNGQNYEQQSNKSIEEIGLDCFPSHHSTKRNLSEVEEKDQAEEESIVKNRSPRLNKQRKVNLIHKNVSEQNREASNQRQETLKTEMKEYLKLEELDRQQKMLINRILSHWENPKLQSISTIDTKWKIFTSNIKKDKNIAKKKFKFGTLAQ